MKTPKSQNGKFLEYDIFSDAQEQSKDGSTGSKIMTVEKAIPSVAKPWQSFQVKKSILDANLTRRVKAKGTDRENFGEFIASNIARALTGSDDASAFEASPKVYLVYHSKKKRVLVASRYLDDVIGNLNDYAIKDGASNSQDARGHFRVTDKEKKEQDQLSISGDENKLLRKDLAIALCLSALFGDHDVNPTNMVVVEKDGAKKRIARIDFGHAFYDLLSWPRLGGGIKNKDNTILDFLNRETISHLQSKRRLSKLWRTYDVVPSRELVEAFREIGDQNKFLDNLEKGINSAKEDFVALINSPDVNADKNVIQHIRKSLIAINKGIGKQDKEDTKITSSMTTEDLINKLFDNIQLVFTQSQKSMLEVADLMDMQLRIDQIICGKAANNEDISFIKNSYSRLKSCKGIAQGNSTIEWVKYDKKTPAFIGNIEGYIRHKSQSASLSPDQTDKIIAKFKTPKLKSATKPNKNEDNFSVTQPLYGANPEVKPLNKGELPSDWQSKIGEKTLFSFEFANSKNNFSFLTTKKNATYQDAKDAMNTSLYKLMDPSMDILFRNCKNIVNQNSSGKDWNNLPDKQKALAFIIELASEAGGLKSSPKLKEFQPNEQKALLTISGKWQKYNEELGLLTECESGKIPVGMRSKRMLMEVVKTYDEKKGKNHNENKDQVSSGLSPRTSSQLNASSLVRPEL